MVYYGINKEINQHSTVKMVLTFKERRAKHWTLHPRLTAQSCLLRSKSCSTQWGLFPSKSGYGCILRLSHLNLFELKVSAQWISNCFEWGSARFNSWVYQLGLEGISEDLQSHCQSNADNANLGELMVWLCRRQLHMHCSQLPKSEEVFLCPGLPLEFCSSSITTVESRHEEGGGSPVHKWHPLSLNSGHDLHKVDLDAESNHQSISAMCFWCFRANDSAGHHPFCSLCTKRRWRKGEKYPHLSPIRNK